MKAQVVAAAVQMDVVFEDVAGNCPARNDMMLGMARTWEDVVVAALDARRYRGPNRDRRPECYGRLARTGAG